MSPQTILEITSALLATFAIVQGFEFLALKQSYSDHGVWRWLELEPELCGQNWLLKFIFGFTLKAKNFYLLNYLRIFVAFWLLWEPSLLGISFILCIHILTLLRWRGSFNGGSDSMHLMILICVGLCFYFDKSPKLITGCLWYITIQLCLSYFKAGYFKLKNPAWRNGLALKIFLQGRKYASTDILDFILNRRFLLVAASWLVLIFELSFPLAVLNISMAFFYIAAGAFFMSAIFMSLP